MLADFPASNNGYDISFFADDVAIYHTTQSKEHTVKPLQKLLKKIERWSAKWKFRFSVDKCASLSFTRKRQKEPAHQLKLCGEDIAEVTQYKFLGITFDRKLSWEPPRLWISCVGNNPQDQTSQTGAGPKPDPS